ncbi:MarR family transcriptional regulator [Sphingobium sp. AN641]|uniref:MarR family winged helix-turn-helix transcriptional regulator n=1 Tax=Sphingobium sp. AN641 TaxID=3133443 RepID=UPI0030C14AA1
MKQGSDLKALMGYQVQRAHLIMEADARAALSSFDLSPAKLTALILIRDNPGSDQTALGKALSVNRSSAMKLVNILADRNLVERRSGRDLRTNALHLRPEGEALVAAMLDATRQSDARMTARLTADEVRTLHTLLRKLGPDIPKRKGAVKRDDKG